jgi:hypothetical protein
MTPFFALMPPAPAQVKLVDHAHNVTLTYERIKEGSTIVEREAWKAASGGFTKIEDVYSLDGTQLRRAITRRTNRGQSVVLATINATEAIVSTNLNAATARQTSIPLRGKFGIVDPSALWFLPDAPTKGATATFMGFEPDGRFWQETTVTFLGKAPAGGAEGNMVVWKSARGMRTVVFDDQGMPLSWTEKNMIFVREGR